MTLLHHLSLAILTEALHGGEISELEFETQCRLSGIPERHIDEALCELRNHDQVGVSEHV